MIQTLFMNASVQNHTHHSGHDQIYFHVCGNANVESDKAVSKDICQDKKFKSAFDRIISELQINQIVPSLAICIDKTIQVHDSINETMLLQGRLGDVLKEDLFHPHSVYFIRSRDVFDQAIKSHADAVTTYYNSAFVGLRTVAELLIKGVFYDCLAHKKFRKCTTSKNKQKLLQFFKSLENDPKMQNDLENNSACILDKPEMCLSVKCMFKQICDWGMLRGMKEPCSLYEMYGKLSEYVHVKPNNTDIGQRLVGGLDLLGERQPVPDSLYKYLEGLHKLIDIWMLTLLNILQDRIQESDDVKVFLKKYLISDDFLESNLPNSKGRIKELIKDYKT